jgi:hypothetical protein
MWTAEAESRKALVAQAAVEALHEGVCNPQALSNWHENNLDQVSLSSPSEEGKAKSSPKRHLWSRALLSRPALLADKCRLEAITYGS